MRQISRTRKISSSRAIDYYFDLEVTNAEFSTYYKLYGSTISSFQSDFPDDSIYCIQVGCISAGCGKWIINYHGANTLDDYNFAIVPRKINKSYSVGEFVFTPQMLGVHPASESEYTAKKYNLDGIAVVYPGQYICNNATTSSKGTLDVSGCPITLSSTSITQAQLDKALSSKWQTVIYAVAYPDSSIDPNDFITWVGRNGTFASGTAPGKTNSGVWLARRATSDTVKNGLSTTQYVRRTMELAPIMSGYQTTWNSDLYPTWTWS